MPSPGIAQVGDMGGRHLASAPTLPACPPRPPCPAHTSQPLPPCAGANWVDPPKRERKRVASYAENEFYRMAMQVKM